jgi:hypothetical protein
MGGGGRISTGIPGLDPLLGGGLPACKSYLVTGEPGIGKSIFCMQFTLNGLMLGPNGLASGFCLIPNLITLSQFPVVAPWQGNGTWEIPPVDKPHSLY